MMKLPTEAHCLQLGRRARIQQQFFTRMRRRRSYVANREVNMKTKHGVFVLPAALGILSALLASGVFADTPKRGPATIKELMTLLVDPASNAVFQAASEP